MILHCIEGLRAFFNAVLFALAEARLTDDQYRTLPNLYA